MCSVAADNKWCGCFCRLGGSEEDVREIQRHPFFAPINWDDLYHKRVRFCLVIVILSSCFLLFLYWDGLTLVFVHEINYLVENCVCCMWQLTPPWKPDISSDCDTKYIPEEFSNEPVQLTPPEGSQLTAAAAAGDNVGELPYFEKFSYHGSRGSLGSYLSTSSMSTTTTFE